MRSWIGVAALTTACADGAGGTAVGNPGHLDVVLADVPYDVSLARATFEIAAVEVEGCGRSAVTLQPEAPFDALAPSPADFPGGEWCHTVVLPAAAGALRIEGEFRDEPFSLELSPEPFALAGRYVVDGDTVLISLSLAAAMRAGADGSPAQEPDLEEGSWAPNAVGAGLYLADDYTYDEAPTTRVAEPVEPRGCRTAGGATSLWVAGLLALRRRRQSCG